MTSHQTELTDEQFAELTSKLVNRIAAGLPHCLGGGATQQDNAINNALEKFSAFLHAAFADTLSQSTRQYQTYLLSATLIWLVVHVFKLNAVSLNGQTVPIDEGFAFIFSALIGLLILIFFLKAQTDIKIRRLESVSKFALYTTLPQMLQESIARVQIDMYYFNQFGDKISTSYGAYSKELAQKFNLSLATDPLLLGDWLDVSELRKLPLYAGQFHQRDVLLSEVGNDLEISLMEVRERIRAIQRAPEEVNAIDYISGYSTADRIYERSRLKAWIEARSQLASMQLSFVFDTSKDGARALAARHTQEMIDQSKSLGSRTIFAEVALPIIFGLAGLAYYWVPQSGLVFP